jgi:hypothetical protein
MIDAAPAPTRRAFLQVSLAAGGGLVLGLSEAARAGGPATLSA